jgi:tetratricopeptide (TPR) repeat protein
LRLFAYALLAALALCDSAWGVEQESAKDCYARAVRDAEQQYGPNDGSLVEPLASLAEALVAAGQPAQAIEPLTRALGILRRNSGLYDRRQYALLSQLIDAYSLQGDVNEAVAALAYMERVSERTHGRHSEGVATSRDSLESYRGPVLTRSRISISSPTFQHRVLKILRSDGEQALRYAAQLAETAVEGTALETEGVRLRQAF